jgi:hypothetical protein
MLMSDSHDLQEGHRLVSIKRWTIPSLAGVFPSFLYHVPLLLRNLVIPFYCIPYKSYTCSLQ